MNKKIDEKNEKKIIRKFLKLNDERKIKEKIQ